MSQTSVAPSSHSSLVRAQWLPIEAAVQKVTDFERRFGESHLQLACYAALPLILTPELLNLIRINFLADSTIPWIAEADFLLSSLCRPIGEDLYEVEPSIREVLLVELEDRFGWRSVFQIARFLQAYLTQPNLKLHPEVNKTLSWIAKAYLEPDRVIAEISASLQVNQEEPESLSQLEGQLQAVLMVEILAEPLKEASEVEAYQSLLVACQGLAAELYGEVGAGEQRGDGEQEESDLGQEDDLPPLQSFIFEVVEFVASEPLSTFEFETVTVDARGQAIRREQRQASYFVQRLGEGVPPLEMIAIPAGSFVMGSPEDEPGRYGSESPQREVRVPFFFMSKYLVTQAQWKFVAGLEPVNRELELDPSNFKGDDRPVEQVNWYEAVEFCNRLSKHTSGMYRLPSEAEWEYACRDGTTTPFHFGETITGELANYDASVVYRQETEGRSRGETTPVGSFPPNGFGLYDMHGNVWEWCADDWHSSYEGAPTDGSAWVDERGDRQQKNEESLTAAEEEEAEDDSVKKDEDIRRVLRGGSWFSIPRPCRSASRFNDDPDSSNYYDGFRVVFSPSRT